MNFRKLSLQPSNLRRLAAVSSCVFALLGACRDVPPSGLRMTETGPDDSYYRETPNFHPAPPPPGVQFTTFKLDPSKTGSAMSEVDGHAEKNYKPDKDATVGNGNTLHNRADVPAGAFGEKVVLTCDLDNVKSFSAVVFGPHQAFPADKRPRIHFNFEDYGLTAEQVVGMKVYYYNYETAQWELIANSNEITIDKDKREISCFVPHWSTFAFGY